MNYASLLPADVHPETRQPSVARTGAPPQARWLVRLARLIPHARR